MTSYDRLRILARELGVREDYVKKKYVNSWFLWDIFTSDYGDNLLFKGGKTILLSSDLHQHSLQS